MSFLSGKCSGSKRMTRTKDIVVEQCSSHKYALVAREPSLERHFSSVGHLAGGGATFSRHDILDARVKDSCGKERSYLIDKKQLFRKRFPVT